MQFDHAWVFIIEDRPAGTTTLVNAVLPDNGHELVPVLKSELGGVDRLVITHSNEDHFGRTSAVLDASDPKLLVLGGAEGLYGTLDIEADHHFHHDDVLDGGIRVV